MVDNELKLDHKNRDVNANRKSTASIRIRKYLDLKKMKISFETFFKSQSKIMSTHLPRSIILEY